MTLLRQTLEQERHEPVQGGDPYGVPTGVVPRFSGFIREVGPRRAPDDRSSLDAAINQALDEYEALVHDAACWRRHLAEQAAKVPK